MAKRRASNYLHKDNWDQDEDAEELGVFKKASDTELKNRVIKRAKRRGDHVTGESHASVFNNFTAFSGNTTDIAPKFNIGVQTSTVMFSFGKDSPIHIGKTSESASFETTSKLESQSFSTPSIVSSESSTSISNPLLSSFNFGNKPINSSSENKLTNGGSSTSSPMFSFGNKESNSNPLLSSSTITSVLNNSKKPSSSEFSSKTMSPVNPLLSSKSLIENTSNSKPNSENAVSSSVFSFGSKSNDLSAQSSSMSSKPDSNKVVSSESKLTNGKSSKSNHSLYCSHLKNLNKSVLKWSQKHLDENPYINMTPIFEDYKKHIEDLKKKYPSSDNESKVSNKECDKISEKKDSNIGSQESGLFSFGSQGSSKDYGKKGFSFGSQESRTFSFGSETSSKCAEAKKEFSFSFQGKDSECKTPQTGTFSFGSKDSSKGFSLGSSDSSKGFSFGSSGNEDKKGFSFGTNAEKLPLFSGNSAPSSSQNPSNEPSDDVPNVQVNEVKEDDAIYEKKVKLFYKKDESYVDKGVGTLFLKPAGEKVQLLIRANTNLGNILLNILLNDSIPTQRVGKNNVLIVCIPNPPIDPKAQDKNSPVSMLIRVKTAADADELLAKIDENKN